MVFVLNKQAARQAGPAQQDDGPGQASKKVKNGARQAQLDQAYLVTGQAGN